LGVKVIANLALSVTPCNNNITIQRSDTHDSQVRV